MEQALCMQVSHEHVATVMTYSRQSFHFHGPCEMLYLTETKETQVTLKTGA